MKTPDLKPCKPLREAQSVGKTIGRMDTTFAGLTATSVTGMQKHEFTTIAWMASLNLSRSAM